MTPHEALERILAGATANDLEHQHLDFKIQGRSRDDAEDALAQAATCFANATGGVIVLGVADRVTGAAAFVGTDMDAGLLRRRIYEKSTPNLDVIVKDIEFNGVRLLEIAVQQGLDVHMVGGRTPRRRLDTTCISMSTSEIARLHEERRGADWSSTSSGRAISDIDEQAALQLRALLRSSRNAPDELASRSLVDMLAALSLVTSTGELTQAGALLLCPPAPDQVRDLLVYQFRETAGGEVRHGRRWQAPLLIAAVEALTLAEARIGSVPLNLPGGQQIQIQDYPIVAIREALANAITHGDLREGRPVVVEHSPQLLTVYSPGPLVAGITPANILTHPPRPRFASLAAIMRNVGLAEQYGLGVDRMFKEMIRSGRDVPVVEVLEGDHAETVVRFTGGPSNARIARFIASLPMPEQDDTDVLLLIHTLASRRSVNAASLAPIIQRDETSAQSTLLRLSQGPAQIIEPTPRSVEWRFPEYRLRSHAVAELGSALTYQARPKPDAADKLVDHVKEYGSINNAAVRRMFDIDVYAARDMLRGLVDRRVLIRTSKQTRGTAVKYGAGEQFPEKP